MSEAKCCRRRQVQPFLESKELPNFCLCTDTSLDARIRSRFDQEHKLPEEKCNLSGLRKFRISARCSEDCVKAFVTTNLRFSCFFFEVAISLLHSDWGMNIHFVLTILTYPIKDFGREKNNCTDSMMKHLTCSLIWSAPRSADPCRMSKKMKRAAGPHEHMLLFAKEKRRSAGQRDERVIMNW